jgi:tetratricopeptide (TPR) repeat protein
LGGEGDEVGVESGSISQGCGHKHFIRRPNSFYKLVLSTLIISIFAGTGQAGLFNKKHSKPNIYKPVECENLSRRIKQLVCELEYSDEVSEDFVTMIDSWQRKTNPFFVVRGEKLRRVREDYKQGSIKITDVVKDEKSIVSEIAWLIENKLGCADEDFELADIIKNKKASCLGFTQLFYILGNSIDLSVIPINVAELQRPGPLPTGAAHVSCMVGLSDGRTIMLNSAAGGFVSEPFMMEEKFTKIGDYWQLKDKDNPLNIYRKIQLLDRDGLTAYIYSNRGAVYASAGQFNRAITNYNRAIELNPNFADAYNHRGIAYHNLGQLKQAVADYTKAIELKPNYIEAYNNRGIAYEKLGQPEQGICDYNTSIELNPNLAEAYNNRANAYVKLGQFDQAISDYTRAIKNKSSLAEAYGNRAVTYALTVKTKWAKKDLLKAIEIKPDLKRQFIILSEHLKLDSTD